MSRQYDLLLEWASEKGSGSWSELKASWQWLASTEGRGVSSDPAEAAGVAAATLSSLAHIDLSWDGGGTWAAAPPVLTMLPNSGGRALLTGGRTRALYQPGGSRGDVQSGVLARKAEEMDLWIDDVDRPDAPTAVMIACNSPGDAEALAGACEIGYSYSVSEQLAGLLPPLHEYLRLSEPGGLPQGFPVEWFAPRTLEWAPAAEDTSVPGLYRSRGWRDHTHVLVSPTGETHRVEREHAIYEVLRWEGLQVLRYASASRELWVPARAGLPLMQARAAVLCSGLGARFHRHHGVPGKTFVNVPTSVATAIAASLVQELTNHD